MAHSLELRVPLCDHHLLAFACSLSAGKRFTGLKLKGFMRSALRDSLPQQTLVGPKQGFMIPLARWLRQDLYEMSRDLLSDAAVRRRGYVEPSYVQWLLQAHARGDRNFADQIYALMVLELWHQQLNRRPTVVRERVGVA
jgi:asparagine synthase (glutamine-hydrolysing)